MRIWIAIALAVLVVACAARAPVCSAPYILHDGACCPDTDADGACDARTSTDGTAFSCDLCPPTFVTQKEEVPVYKYVCMNESVMDTPEECGSRAVSDAHLFSVHKDQDASILAFDARPACRGVYRAAEIHVKPATSPQWITLQVMDDPETSFRDAYTLNGSDTILDDEYLYIGFCKDCDELVDVALPPDGAYLVRATLHYASGDIITRDRLLDPTPQGEYGTQDC